MNPGLDHEAHHATPSPAASFQHTTRVQS